MNYRHAFHAGSFADVFKHAVLCRILHYLRDKPAAFRVIDTHAGAGLYDLAGAEANRGGEWHDGIERLMAAELAAAGRGAARALSRGDRRAQRARPAQALSRLAGAGARLAAAAGPADRLRDRAEGGGRAARNMRGDTAHQDAGNRRLDRARRLRAAAGAARPGAGRSAVRGGRRFLSAGAGACRAHRKWASGIYALWYPIKGRAEPDALAKRLRQFRHRQNVARRTHRRPAYRPDPAQRLRADPGQSAVDAGKRAFRAAAGAGRHPRPRGQRRIPAGLADRRGRQGRAADGVRGLFPQAAQLGV